MTPLERAIDAVGGVAALASAIDVPASNPGMWKKRGRVPAEYCPLIERAVRAVAVEKGIEPVTCEELRPDVAWDVLRMQATPGLRPTVLIDSGGGPRPTVLVVERHGPSTDHPRRRSYERDDPRPAQAAAAGGEG